VSLILEALKKVERERATPEQRGFLVLGPAAWAPARSNAGWIVGIIAAAGVAGGIVYGLTRADTEVGRRTPAAADQVVPGPSAPPVAGQQVPPVRTDWGPPPRSAVPRTRSAAAAPAASTPSPSAPPGPVLVLHAISEQDGVPIAVVNERVVREGDSFDGVRIVRIGPADVEVEVAGARRVLRF
jgi:hypothetical protein